MYQKGIIIDAIYKPPEAIFKILVAIKGKFILFKLVKEF